MKVSIIKLLDHNTDEDTYRQEVPIASALSTLLEESRHQENQRSTLVSHLNMNMDFDDDDGTRIPIRYINNTGKVDFEVMVFTKNYNTKTPKIYYVAWHVLRAQSIVDFSFSSNLSIGAFYKENGLVIRAGPFLAESGSTWTIVQNDRRDTAVLNKGKVQLKFFFIFHCSKYDFSLFHVSRLIFYQSCMSIFAV